MKRTTTLRALCFTFLTLAMSNFASAFGISFTTNNSSGCAPVTVTFTNTSNDTSAYRYEWNFGDNTLVLIDTLSTTVTHTFVNPGSYYVYLNVYDVDGNYVGYASSNNAIEANGPYFYINDSVCKNDVVSFYPYGGNFTSYLWDFGDGNMSNLASPTHQYTSLGFKTVKLTTTGSCGQQQATKTIKISSLIVPYPYISANPSGTTCPGVPIEFNTGEFTTYSWNFGGGASANIKNPTHAYNSTGSKTITLNVTNNCNQSNSTTYNTFITNTPPPFPNQSWFQLQASPAKSCPNTTIGFNAPSGYSNYEWNFGDGSPIVTTSNSYNDHLYGNNLGTFIASVKITAPCGNDTILYDTVTISTNAPFPINQNYYLYVNSSPSCPNSNIGFNAPSGFSNYQWNFGDGAIINTTNAYTNHTYGNTITTYTVSVKITNSCGNDTILYSSLTINGNLTFPNTNSFNVTSSPSSSCPNTDIYFQAPYGYTSYQWTFGDGTASNTTQYGSEYHKYTSVGTYTYKVKIVNGCGKDTTLVGNVTIVANQNFPTSNFELNHNPHPACPNDFVNFNAPQGYPYYEWNFGDGSPNEITYNDNYRSHKFSGTNALYVVSVKIKNGCGNMTMLFDTVHINNNVGFDNTGLEFYAYETTICPGTNVGFNAPYGYTNYEWNFGDNTGTSFSSSNYFSHVFGNQIDTLNVSVKITNGCGNDTTLYTQINVVGNMMFPKNNFNVNHSPEPACANDFVNFNAPQGFPYYEWNFGDGSPILVGDQNYASHKFGTNSFYFVSVKIKNGCGNDTILYDTVHISNNLGFPTGANFILSSNEAKICPGSFAYFSAPYGYNSYEWNFGDNSPLETSTSNGFNHQYGNQITTYTVSVKITNGCNNDTTLFTTLIIDSNIGFPMGTWFNVQAGPNPACPNDVVGFNAPGGYNNYKWTFGDGDSIASSQSYVGHKYTTPGNYNYSVKVTNACNNDTILYGTIQISTSGSTQNSLDIQTNNQGPSCPGDLISFDLNQGGYSNYYWYFSDGDTVITNGNSIQHAFDSVGTYTVICKVINGCGDTIKGQKTVQVVNNNPINNSLNISSSPNPACPNDVVFFNIENGQSTNQYIWNFGDGSPADTTIGVGLSHVYTSAGTKTVTVLVTNSCGSAKTITLTQIIGSGTPPSLQNNGSPNWGSATNGGGGSNNTVGCAGDAIVFYFEGTSAQNQWSFGDGSTGIATETIVVDGGGGSFPVTIIKHVFQENGQFTIGLTLTNGCGLSVTDSMVINIGGGQAVNGTMTTSPPPFTTCAPIDFIALGGANYSWNFGDSTTLNSTSPTVSHTYSNPGIYVASVVITNGCGSSATYTKVVNVTGVSGPQISLIGSNSPNCSGASNGYASISAAGGQAPYTYAWSDANAQNTAIATGLSSGIYNVTVTDNIGCSSVLTISITDPAPIVVTTSTTQSTCGSATGSATATVVSGGTAPYTYYWSPGAASTATISNLAYGTYTVAVSDNNGCQVTKNVTVSDANSATITSDSVVNISCNGTNNGAIYITVSGTATYTYAWSNGATTQNITGLAAGSYSVQITGNNGCSAVYSTAVEDPGAIQVQATTVTSPTCGNFDGTAGATVTGGTAPYTYLWDANSGSQTTVNATGLPAGNYSVIVTDANGCTDSADISLSNLNAPQLSAVITDISCNGDTDGAINLSVTGGTSPYLYTWNVPPPQTNNQDLNTLAAGNYLIFVNDAQGCLSVRTYTIATPNVLTVSTSATGATCSLNNATAMATVTGGTLPYTYAWSSGDTTATADSLIAGTYTLIVTDNNSCVAYDSTTVETIVATPSICMVTVDENSINNEIYWDKTNYTNVDSFIVYREVSSNLYKRIGAVDYTALSTFTDTTRSVGPANGDPNVSTYRYKLQIRDNCGNYGDMSAYHNTIFIQFDENTGVFSWNPSYTIEGGALTPVANYILICDTTNNVGTWFEVGTTAGTQNTVADTDYNNHKNHPDVAWRVKTDWTIECEPTRAIINTSRSNIKKPSSLIGVDALHSDNFVSVYPNPATNNLTIELAVVAGINKVLIINALGQVMYTDTLQGVGNKVKKQINTSAYPKGIYSVVFENNNQRIIKKLVIN